MCVREKEKVNLVLDVHAGYGKTLVILWPACELARLGHFVLIIVPNDFLRSQALTSYDLGIS